MRGVTESVVNIPGMLPTLAMPRSCDNTNFRQARVICTGAITLFSI